VIGLDPDGNTTFVNRSAERILSLNEDAETAVPLKVAIPEFGALLQRLQDSGKEADQDEVRVSRNGVAETLLVRIATRRSAEGEAEGYVIAFDDVTDLVTAQRMAAWGDVARRIAHEIKNPLTPIQLSAGRIKRKFRPMVGDEAEALDRMTDVIVRQTEDLRRIVDEFSKFARMPEPERTRQDLAQIVRDAVTLQEAAAESLTLDAVLPDGPVPADLDQTMIGQALTNLIKNAGEAIESLYEKGEAPEGHKPRVLVEMTVKGGEAVISISDNGIGLPEDRSRLFEPYVTTRAKGTGLGLPIVKKIIEEHGGTLRLDDADPLDASGQVGARAEIRLPLQEAA
jgi:two-component system nitrogen regulation sensor histidine kinase NtrY